MFWKILLAINVLVVAVLFLLGKRSGGDDLSRSMGGFVFWLGLFTLGALDCIAVFVRLVAQRMLMVLIIAGCVLTVHAQAQCGVERTPVKTLKDPAVKQIHLQAKLSTVAALRLEKAPGKWGNSMARLDAEMQAYEVPADVIGYKYEKDGDRDYHVVLSTPGKPAETMILEIPHPDCAASDVDRKLFAELRAFIDALGPRPSPKFVTLTRPVPVTAAGVLFFDKIHGQKGVAPNGVELHPGLKLVERR